MAVAQDAMPWQGPWPLSTWFYRCGWQQLASHALSSERAVGASGGRQVALLCRLHRTLLVLSASGTVAGDVSLGPAADGDDARERAAPVESEPPSSPLPRVCETYRHSNRRQDGTVRICQSLTCAEALEAVDMVEAGTEARVGVVGRSASATRERRDTREEEHAVALDTGEQVLFGTGSAATEPRRAISAFAVFRLRALYSMARGRQGRRPYTRAAALGESRSRTPSRSPDLMPALLGLRLRQAAAVSQWQGASSRC